MFLHGRFCKLPQCVFANPHVFCFWLSAACSFAITPVSFLKQKAFHYQAAKHPASGPKQDKTKPMASKFLAPEGSQVVLGVHHQPTDYAIRMKVHPKPECLGDTRDVGSQLKTKNLPAMLPTATQNLQQPERGSVLLKPISLVASKPISFFVWLNSTHAMLSLPLAISITTTCKQKGGHVLMCTREASRL